MCAETGKYKDDGATKAVASGPTRMGYEQASMPQTTNGVQRPHFDLSIPSKPTSKKRKFDEFTSEGPTETLGTKVTEMRIQTMEEKLRFLEQSLGEIAGRRGAEETPLSSG
jgi:hypothetical protein